MSSSVQKQSQPFAGKQDEQILVVARDVLFNKEMYPEWTGVRPVDVDQFMKLINDKKEFLWRSVMESDQTYKQIIPYLIFEHDGRYFLMQRRATSSETRLSSKFSLGIGGHLRKEDMQDSDIFSWACREFHEEINYSGSFEIEPIGLLNDDTNDVGKVHLGFVLLLRASSSDISVKSELKSGTLATIDECRARYDVMEGWSKFVFDYLQNRE